jgi:glycosyltransferase involved in cell wall biosynthesis
MKVSIILPTYNGSKWIERAIRSILAQSFSGFELFVIDDGSTDNTEKIVSELKIKDNRIIYLRNDQNLGIQKSLNRGLKEASGEYIARIDDDDEWIDQDKLKKQLEFLEANKNHVLVGTGVVMVNETGKELVRYLLPETDKQIRKQLLGKNCFVHSSVVFRKDVAIKLGGYDESPETKHVEDYDLWLKLGTVGKLANLPFHGVRFTLRPGNISSRNKLEQFKKDIKLTRKYKGEYPNYLSALVRGYLRLIFYGVFNFLPFSRVKNLIFKIYKEN